MTLFLLFTWCAHAATFGALAADPVAVLQSDPTTPAGFRIVALSNTADACRRRGDADCLKRVAEAAQHRAVCPWDEGPAARVDYGHEGLYLSHLGIVLAAYDEVVGDGRYDAVHRRIAEHLAVRSLAHPSGVARSYPSTSQRWPADQSVTLAALYRYDQRHGTTLSDAPIERFMAYMEGDGREPRFGLHRSEVTGADHTSELPRGCALSWTVRYLSMFDPEAAEALWVAYRDVFLVRTGPVWGLREWPPGIDGAADGDSGPIVFGIGVSASAFGVGAASAVGDAWTHGKLAASEALAMDLAGLVGGDLRTASGSALAQSIIANR